MQQVTVSNIQNQVSTPIKENQPEQTQNPVKTAPDSQKRKLEDISEDIVNVLADSIAQSPKNKKPSTPVSNEEKQALLEPAAGETRISVYV
jgi:hypothetical protein